MSSPVLFPRRTVHDQAFAHAASRLAGAAAVVTWQADDGPGGLLVRSVSLLSTRPARVLFGVAKDDPAHAALLQAEACALNLLSEGDEDEAARFEGRLPGQGQFTPERWSFGPDQPPRLLAGAVHFAGVVDHRIDAGSHSLFVILVEVADANGRAPLVAFDRGFRRLEQKAVSA